MRILTIAEVLQMEPGETVPGIRGVINSVGGYYTGNSQLGPWSLQRAILTNGSDKIRLRFSNRSKLGPEWNGHEVILTCVSGKNGPVGMKVSEDEYRGVKQKEIFVGEKAILDTAANAAACGVVQSNSVESAAETPHAQPKPAQQPPAPAPVHTPPSIPTQPVPVAPPAPHQGQPIRPQTQLPPTPNAQQPTAAPNTTGAVQQAAPVKPKSNNHARPDLVNEQERLDKMLFVLATTYLRCMDAADWVNAERTANKQEPMSPEHYQACVSSLFIQVMRNCQN